MLRILSLLVFLTASAFVPHHAQASYYTCPSGGSLSGSTCTIGANYAASGSYSCPSSGSLSGSTCTVGGSYTATVSAYTFMDPWMASGYDWWPGSPLSAIYSYNGVNNLNAQPSTMCWTDPNTGINIEVDQVNCETGCTYTFVGCPTPVFSCPSGGTLSGGTCITSSSYGATLTYSCPSGGYVSGSTCINTTTYAATLNYQCNAGDAGPYWNGSYYCVPALLTSTATNTYTCQVVAGDPVGAGWYMLNGSTPVTSLTQQSNVAAPTCYYQPPTVDGVYSFSTYSCTSPNTLSGTLCWPPVQILIPSKSTGYNCPSPDVLGGTTCTPPISIIPAVLTTTYSCSGVNDYLSAVTHQCIPLLQTSAAIATQAYICDNTSVLNPLTNVCNKLNIPAVAIQGAWSCPADYTLSGSWCLPTTQTTYPAAWYMGSYTCLNGGSLGAITGLCYK